MATLLCSFLCFSSYSKPSKEVSLSVKESFLLSSSLFIFVTSTYLALSSRNIREGWMYPDPEDRIWVSVGSSAHLGEVNCLYL